MLNKLRLYKADEAGFTLIELLVVILIIGILAAIAVPVFLNQQKAALTAGIKSDVRNTVSNVQLYIAENPGDLEEFNARTDVTGSDDKIKLVKSDKDTLMVARGTAANYFVLGRNAKVGPIVDGFSVVYYSSTGKTTVQNK